jgi:hypothetical protein
LGVQCRECDDGGHTLHLKRLPDGDVQGDISDQMVRQSKRIKPEFDERVDWSGVQGFNAMMHMLSFFGTTGEYVLKNHITDGPMTEEDWKTMEYKNTSRVHILHTLCDTEMTPTIRGMEQGYLSCPCRLLRENQYRQVDGLSDGQTYIMQTRMMELYWKCKSHHEHESTFDLKLDDVFRLLQAQGGRCALSGIVFDVTKNYLCPSIDAKDPSNGHTVKNCHIVLRCVNYGKNRLTVGEFKRVLNGEGGIVYDRPSQAKKGINITRLVDPTYPLDMTPRQTFVWHALKELASPLSRQQIETYINTKLSPSMLFCKNQTQSSLNQFISDGYVERIQVTSSSPPVTKLEYPPLPTAASHRTKGTIYRASKGVYKKWNGYRFEPQCRVCAVKSASHPDNTGLRKALCADHAREEGTYAVPNPVWRYRPVLPLRHPIISCGSCTTEIPIQNLGCRNNRGDTFTPHPDNPYATNQSRKICRKCRTKSTTASRNRDRMTYIWSKIAARKTGRKDGDLVKDDLEELCTIDACPVLGIPLVYESGWSANQASLDRLDNSIGYSKGNVQIVSLPVNYARQELWVTNDELRSVFDACRAHLNTSLCYI